MNNLIFLLFASPPQVPDGTQPPFWINLIPWVIIFAVAYFVLIRPQVKRQKEQEEMLKKVKSGDRVVAAGGIVGTVANVKDDIVTLKTSDGVKIEVLKASVTSVTKKESIYVKT